MSIPDPSTLDEAVYRRHSVRAYTGAPLSDGHRRAIQTACARQFPPTKGARMILVPKPGRVFPGIVIRGAPAFLAMVGDAREPHAEEAVGYLGEYVILVATALGLGTCWVSGTYRRAEALRLLSLEPTERLYAVSPLGYAGQGGLVDRILKTMTKSGTRRPLAALLTPASLPPAAGPPWVKTALAAARLAPSAVNRQPWRFTVQPDGIKISVGDGGKEIRGTGRRMDCGMAMLHLELGAATAGAHGDWTLLDPPDVGLYVQRP